MIISYIQLCSDTVAKKKLIVFFSPPAKQNVPPPTSSDVFCTCATCSIECSRSSLRNGSNAGKSDHPFLQHQHFMRRSTAVQLLLLYCYTFVELKKKNGPGGSSVGVPCGSYGEVAKSKVALGEIHRPKATFRYCLPCHSETIHCCVVCSISSSPHVRTLQFWPQTHVHPKH